MLRKTRDMKAKVETCLRTLIDLLRRSAGVSSETNPNNLQLLLPYKKMKQTKHRERGERKTRERKSRERRPQ
jgi:hypothetical protein